MCHTPSITEESDDSEWLCRVCVFSKATKVWLKNVKINYSK